MSTAETWFSTGIARCFRPITYCWVTVRSAHFDAEHDDVAQVRPGGIVERAAAGDQVQLGVGGGPVHLAGGKVRLRVLAHRGHPERGQPAIRLPDVNLVARA